jgi:hypothetical protein
MHPSSSVFVLFVNSVSSSRDYEDKIRTAVIRWQQQLLVKMFHSWREYRRSDDDDDLARDELASAPTTSSSARVGKKRGATSSMVAAAAAANGMHRSPIRSWE